MFITSTFLPLATKLGQGFVFTHVCDSVHRRGYPSMHCRWYPSMPCSRSPGGWGWYPSMPCRFPGPHPRAKLMGLAWGGSPRPHPGGSLGPHPGGSPGPHWGEIPGPHPGGKVSRPTPRGGGSPGPHPGGCIPACTEADSP